MFNSIWMYRLKLIACNPLWALREIYARWRESRVAASGIYIRSILPGPVKFEFDLALSPSVRAMYADSYERHVVDLMRELLREGDTFVDVGANIGYLSTRAAGMVGMRGRVLSFEPEEKAFARLTKARELNPEHRWEVFHSAVGDGDYTRTLEVSGTNIGWNSLVPGNIPPGSVARSSTVHVEPLDSILQRLEIDRVRLVKIDVEGFEGAVLMGMRELLSRRKVDHIIVELNMSAWAAQNLDVRAVFKQLGDWGYTPFDTRCRWLTFSPVVVPGVLPDVWFRGA